MKNSSPGTKILMTVICLAVLAYFGLQGYRYFHDPMKTVVCYAYQVEKTLSANGFVVRDEQVLPASGGGLLQLTRSEGEKVAVGSEIARVYSDQASLDNQNQIDSLQMKLEQLQFAQETAEGAEVALKLDSQIMESILALQSDLAADRLDAAGDRIAALRALVMKRDYTYSDSADLPSQIEGVEGQIASLKAKTASSVHKVTAPVSGLYSAVVDGYETVLKPDGLSSLTPSTLLSTQPDGSDSSDVGKLILGDQWYYAAVMQAADAKQLTAGGTEKLRFAKGLDRDLEVTVQSVGEEESGKSVVVFRCGSYLPEMTLLRRQTADVIAETVTGIRVPQDALRVDEDGQAGLYCVVGLVVRFKPVTVLYTGGGYVLVQAASDGEKTRLRAGDQVVISAARLYDGKVVN